MENFYDSLSVDDKRDLQPKFSEFYFAQTLRDSITEKQYLFSSFAGYPELLMSLISNDPNERSFGLKQIERSQKITQISLLQNIIAIENANWDWALYARCSGEENIWTYIYRISSNSPEMAMIILNTLEISILNQNKVSNTIAKVIYKKILNSLKQDWLNWKIYVEESNFFSNLALLSYRNLTEYSEKLNQMVTTNSSFTAWVPPFPLLKIKEIVSESCCINDNPPAISFYYISLENEKRFLTINTSNFLKNYQFYNQIFFYLDEISKISGLPFKFWKCNFLNMYFSFEKDNIIGNIIDQDYLQGNALIIDNLPQINEKLELQKLKENFITSYAGYSLSFFLMNIFMKGDKLFNISDDWSILSLNLINVKIISHNRLGIEKQIFAKFIQGDLQAFNIYKNAIIQGYKAFRSFRHILHPLFQTIEISNPFFKSISKSFAKKICYHKSLSHSLNFISQQILDLDTSF
ncbi:unnamed protein product [Blepharisma stoltei]|uniref:Uncharacterized protein n=1 Tax=Blepharisma stoltei TaxID=1481888 RepID=A0AAU9IYC1_9CILI|nr:unnamed protein product [Blepharisma stoltei]